MAFEVAPRATEYLPAMHPEHAVLPATENLPAGHNEQDGEDGTELELVMHVPGSDLRRMRREHAFTLYCVPSEPSAVSP